MGYLTKYGAQYGDLPMSMGKTIFFVAPAASYTVGGNAYSASDNNDGLSPERALLTIGQAITNATANAGDVIALLPGTHTSAAAARSKAGLTFVGLLPYFPQSQVGGYHGWQPQGHGRRLPRLPPSPSRRRTTTFYNIRFLPIHRADVRDDDHGCGTDEVRALHGRQHGCHRQRQHQGHRRHHGEPPARRHFMGCIFKDASVTTSNGEAVNLAASVDFWIYKCTVYKDGQIASGVAGHRDRHRIRLHGHFEEMNYVISEISVGDTKVITAAALAGAASCTASAALDRQYRRSPVRRLRSRRHGPVPELRRHVAGGTGGTLITAST
jgi:hypothetical protein